MSRFTLSLCLVSFCFPALAGEKPSFPELKAAFEASAGQVAAQRLKHLRKLGACKSAACVEYLESIRSGDGEDALKLEAVRLMGQVGVDPARERLEAVLDGPATRQHPNALSALALVRPRVPVARFLAATVGGQAAALRLNGARALAGYPTPAVAARLAALAGEGELTESLPRTAANSLRRVATDEAVDAWLVEQALRDARLQPVLPLLLHLAGASAHEDARAAVTPHLRHPLGAVRAAAADALGALASGAGALAQASQDRLLPLIEDADPAVALAAAVALGRIGPAGEALEVLLKQCQAKGAGRRAVALNALRERRDPRVLAAAQRALKDRSPVVRAAAVAALRVQGGREAVGALIGALRKNDEGRLGADIRAALRALTGANPGDEAKAWKRWWKLARDDYQVTSVRASAPRRGASRTRGVPTYYGSEVVSRRVSFVVDVSGSMRAKLEDGRTRLDVCKEQLRGVIQELPKGTHFNVIWFHGGFEPWAEQLQPATRASKRAALAFVDGLKARGGTNIYDPLETALLDGEVDTIYLLSDGAPGAGKYTQRADILREVQKLNAARQVAIHTVAVGAKSELLEQLAKQNAGQGVVH